MSKPKHITFTGVDANTDLDRLADISRRYRCEWGVLFSKNRQGIDNRYPAEDVIERILARHVSYAAHVCGKYAQDIMSGTYTDGLPLDRFRRIQVNHVSPNLGVLAEFAAKIGRIVISQWRDPDFFVPSPEGVQLLYDPSGGRGTATFDWPVNKENQVVGYAGGINPDNAESINSLVATHSPTGYWLDMESGVRTDDWLDLDKVEAVLKAVYD